MANTDLFWKSLRRMVETGLNEKGHTGPVTLHVKSGHVNIVDFGSKHSPDEFTDIVKRLK